MKKDALFSAIITILFVLALTVVLASCGGGGGGTPSGGDTTAPTMPTNLNATAPSSSQISLSWNASSDNVGVVGYKIYRGGVYIKSVAGSPSSDTGLSSSTSYCYTVSAYDAANNESSQSTQACATTADGTPPTTPQNLRATTVSSSEISLSWDASTDNVRVTAYKIYRDGVFVYVTNLTASDTGLSSSTAYCYTVSAVDAAGNESSQSTQACATTHYTKQVGTSLSDYATGVAVDTSGNVYVTGSTYGGLDGNTNAGISDMFLVKYNSSGTKQWTRQLGTSLRDEATGVAVDTSGNVYVAGYTYGGLDGNTNAGGSDIFLVKYNSSGTKQWTRQRQLRTAPNDYATGVAVDTSGNVYVTGYFEGSDDGTLVTPGNDYVFIVKYDSTGTEQWTELLGTSAVDYGYGIAVDINWNVYVTGYTNGSLSGNPVPHEDEIFLVKYNSSVIKQWTRQMGTAATTFNGYSHSLGVAVDTSGNVYVTGFTMGNMDGNTNAGASDMFLVKYNTSGTKQWTRQLGTTYGEQGRGIAVDTSGNVYVTGLTGGGLDGNTNAGASDMFLVKYNTSGTKQWTRQFGTTYGEAGRGVAVDTNGNVYVTGSTNGGLDGNTNAGKSDIFLVKYNANGVIQ
ncbi:MAG: hypothetical protein FD159_2562 [Syntrophaceae bacterium]|nr:MAG: hypothetical protein FD159_2562 [Syntrophaceae bacterium]